MPKYVQISPLPQGISIAKVRQVFSTFVTQKIIVKNDKAFIKFSDQNDVDSLEIKYDDNTIPELGNAKIIVLGENFKPSSVQGLEGDAKDFDKGFGKGSKDLSVDSFLQKKKQEKTSQPLKLTPAFIVISQCDQKIVENISQQAIKKIFSKYRIGRIIIYKKQIYIQFLDKNQIQLLQITFPNLQVRQLGPNTSINPTDQNFSYELIKSQLQKYQSQRKQKQLQQIQRQQRIRKQAAQLQQSRKRLSKQMQAHRFSQFSNWSVRPEGEREMLRTGSVDVGKGSSRLSEMGFAGIGKVELFWSLTVLLWGAYIVFF